ncbi:MAG: hypothetical protein NTY98_13875, partial [Verrucomicrobia bacterium]|nr:hypothetical protein [Verrucomicrobiota bacterium]
MNPSQPGTPENPQNPQQTPPPGATQPLQHYPQGYPPQGYPPQMPGYPPGYPMPQGYPPQMPGYRERPGYINAFIELRGCLTSAAEISCTPTSRTVSAPGVTNSVTS